MHSRVDRHWPLMSLEECAQAMSVLNQAVPECERRALRKAREYPGQLVLQLEELLEV
jgi:hypothetical protein